MAAGITHDDVQGTIQRLKEEDPGLARLLKNAYGYAVFPSVGKASAVVGGAFGRGEVFERGKRIGYATLSQLTIGVQLGGETFAEIIVFESTPTLERLKQGKFAFAANASAALVRAGAAASAGFQKGARAFVYSDGGLMLEAAIGGQKFKFKPAAQDEEEDAQDQKDESADQSEARDDSGPSTHERGLAGSAWQGVRDLASRTTDLIKQHPIATSTIGVGVVAGVAVLAVRAMRAQSDGADENDDSSEEPQEEEYAESQEGDE